MALHLAIARLVNAGRVAMSQLEFGLPMPTEHITELDARWDEVLSARKRIVTPDE